MSLNITSCRRVCFSLSLSVSVSVSMSMSVSVSVLCVHILKSCEFPQLFLTRVEFQESVSVSVSTSLGFRDTHNFAGLSFRGDFPETQLVAVYMCVSASVSVSVPNDCVCLRLYLYF